MDLEYVGGFHLATPYGNESGPGWGMGAGRVHGERLSGTAQWSNHPQRRGDGAMLPDARGVITTEDGAEVVFSLTGRTVWLDHRDGQAGRQLLMTLFESDDERYAWLNNTVCMAQGTADPERLLVHLEVDLCLSDLT
jgi:hypothetical protein